MIFTIYFITLYINSFIVVLFLSASTTLCYLLATSRLLSRRLRIFQYSHISTVIAIASTNIPQPLDSANMVLPSREIKANSILGQPINPSLSRMEADLVEATSRHRKFGNENMTRKIPSHVGIIGAGISGLKAADILLANGVKVTILEGRNRVGGRMAQTKLNGRTVDLGPNWIHGTKNNPLYDIILESGGIIHEFSEAATIYLADKSRVPQQIGESCYDVLWESLTQAFKYSDENSDNIPVDQNIMHVLTELITKNMRVVLDHHGITDEAEIQRRIDIALRLTGHWGSFIGGEVTQQSLKNLWLEETLGGSNLFCAETYEKALQIIAKPAMDGADIRFGQKVVKIKGKVEGSNEFVSVETSDGSKYEFDEVVVTAPLGWLKRNLDAFEPSAPKIFKEAVESLGYGNLDKLLVTFPEAFWVPPIDDDTVINEQFTEFNTSPLPNTVGTTDIAALQSSTEKPERTQSPPFHIHLGESTTAPQAQMVISLAHLPGTTAHPTLLFYTSGATSTSLSSLLPPSTGTPYTSHSPLTSPLAPYLATYLPLLPHYSATNPAHVPQSVLATNWTADELAGYGSYTNLPVGLDRADEHMLALRRGMPETGVWIAGEHTAPFLAFATVSGAWWSGKLVAEEILGHVVDEPSNKSHSKSL